MSTAMPGRYRPDAPVSSPRPPEYTVAYLETLRSPIVEFVRARVPADMRLVWPNSRSTADLKHVIGDADFAIVAMTPVDRALLKAAKRLRLIQHQGVGYGNLDVEAIIERGIRVALSPIGFHSVAEHTVMLMLAGSRNLIIADRALREGTWLQYELRPSSHELEGKTVGIIGMGRIGQCVAERLIGFGVRIVYHDALQLPADREVALKATRVPLAQLLSEADIITVHVPLSSATSGLLGEEAFRLMKPSAILINTSRGEVVDEGALLRALTEGRLCGAGLDVFIHEPLAGGHPLSSLENVVLTPHIAAGTIESFSAKMELAFDNMRRSVAGEPLRYELDLASASGREGQE